jgi:hypothetical protein
MRGEYNMGKMFIRCLLLSLIINPAFASNQFCDGFEKGYAEGYCYRKPFCIQPISPICPIQRLGENTYKDGYQRGFLQGVNRLR